MSAQQDDGAPYLDQDERDLFSAAFKNVVEAKRSSWKMISSIESKSKDSRDERRAKEYREKIDGGSYHDQDFSGKYFTPFNFWSPVIFGRGWPKIRGAEKV